MGMGGAHPILVPPSLGGILTPEVLSIMVEEEVVEEEVHEEAEVEEEVVVEVVRPTLRQLLGSKRPLSLRYVHTFLNFWSLFLDLI